jgi:hypothetical protein
MNGLGPQKVFGRDLHHKALVLCALTALAAVALCPAAAMAEKKLTDDSEYSDKDFRKCIISDYGNMVDGDDISWVWVDPSVKLARYRVKVGKVDNKSEIRSKSLVSTVKSTFSSYFADMDTKGGNGTLSADVCIYMAENFSAGKAWIPFAGGHQMQAGLGVEMVLRDGKGRTVAKFRHSAREGAAIEAAAQEVAGDLVKYISHH